MVMWFKLWQAATQFLNEHQIQHPSNTDVAVVESWIFDLLVDEVARDQSRSFPDYNCWWFPEERQSNCDAENEESARALSRHGRVAVLEKIKRCDAINIILYWRFCTTVVFSFQILVKNFGIILHWIIFCSLTHTLTEFELIPDSGLGFDSIPKFEFISAIFISFSNRIFIIFRKTTHC